MDYSADCLSPLNSLSDLDTNPDDKRDLIEIVYAYLVTKQYPENVKKNEKRTIRRKANRFEVIDGELYLNKKKRIVEKDRRYDSFFGAIVIYYVFLLVSKL